MYLIQSRLIYWCLTYVIQSGLLEQYEDSCINKRKDYKWVDAINIGRTWNRDEQRTLRPSSVFYADVLIGSSSLGIWC